jgi:hypothetical protein
MMETTWKMMENTWKKSGKSWNMNSNETSSKIHENTQIKRLHLLCCGVFFETICGANAHQISSSCKLSEKQCCVDTSSQRGVIQWSFMILLPSFTYHYPLQYNTVSTPKETMAYLAEFLANVVEPQKRFDWQSFISSTSWRWTLKTQQSW